MRSNKGFGELFPGSVATSSVMLTVGVILAVCSFLPGIHGTVASLLAGLGSCMFLAGFIGLINVRVLANEVRRVTSQPFEDTVLLSQVRGSGIEGIFRDRANVLERIIPVLEEENREIVIVGSSLKGLIGVGYNAVGEDQRVRDILVNALERNVPINILMTNPMVAHHRSQQEGRLDGDIEAEILENLMYLTKLKYNNPNIAEKLTIKLYNGTPTIFMLCTPSLMMINPYPYYSTAYGSFSFIIRGGSDLYRGYFGSHYQRAWTDTRLGVLISENIDLAVRQIKEFIEGTNPHGRKIIPDVNKQRELLEKLEYVTR
jgi:hypothetical protein